MIEPTVRHIYSLLQTQQYDAVEKLTHGIRLSAADIEEAISEYGYRLAPYPGSVELDVVEVTGSTPKEWSVVAPIYTVEEGLSDLSIELSLVDNGQEIYRSELDNIRVR
ncbi:MAG: hypothetical protein NZ789_17880 [Pseudomonadales bacterium]|nr:hypothetical protein [Pseudomonadales bacterium]